MKKRLLSMLLALTLVLSMMPTAVFAAVEKTPSGSMSFTLTNGTWKTNIASTVGGSLSTDKRTITFDMYKYTDASVINVDGSSIRNTKYTGWVLEHKSNMQGLETLFEDLIEGDIDSYINCDPGYILPTAGWSLTAGGLMHYTGTGTAQEKAAYQLEILQANEEWGIHHFDTSSSVIDVFEQYTTYTLTLMPANYIVVYDLAGGSGNISDTNIYHHSNVDSDNSVIPVTAVRPTKAGHKFIGWSLSGVGKYDTNTISVDAYWDNTSVVGSLTDGVGEFTLTALWQEVVEYTITYMDGNTQQGQQTYEYGANVTAIADPTKDGYTFTGWNPAVPATMPAENVIVYAQWDENKVTVNYVAKNGGTVSRTTETVGVVTETLSGSTATPNNNYYFVGWYSDEACTDENLVSSSAAFIPETKTAATYYAKFDTVKTVTITVTGNSDSKVYNGEEQSVSGYTVTYTVDGEEVDCPAGIDLVPANSVGANAVAKGTNVNATGYQMSLSNADFTVTDTSAEYEYTLVVTPGKLIITPQEITITVTGNTGTKTYTGTEQSVSGFTVSDDKPEEISVTLMSGVEAVAKGTNASSEKYMMGLTKDSFEITGADNYDVTLNVTDGWLLINKANSNKTFAAAPYSGTYDATPHGITVSGTESDDTLYYSIDNQQWTTAAPTRTNVQAAETIYVKAENPNYETRTANATITITPAAVTVTAVDNSKTYGNSDPTLTATVSGLIGSDTVAYTVTRTAGENVGTYAITPSGKPIQGNYTVTYDSGNFRITPKAVTVTAENKSKAFGEADPVLTATVSGLLGNDTVSYTLTRAAGENVGTYTITPSGDKTQGNYTVDYNTGELTIVAANGNAVTANGYTDVYDGAAHGITAEALKSGSTLYYSTDAGDNKTWSTTAPTFTNVCDYTVYVYATNPNYGDAAVTSAVVSITQRPVTVTVNDSQKVFGADDPIFTGTVEAKNDVSKSGLVNSADLGTVAYRRTNDAEAVGTYEDVLTATYTANSNYAVTVIPGDFTITTADFIVTDKKIVGDKTEFKVGDTVTFEITVKNKGNGAGTVVATTVTDILQYKNDSGEWVNLENTWVTYPDHFALDVAAGETKSFQVTWTVPASAVGKTIKNTAVTTGSSDTPEETPEIVIEKKELVVEKTVDKTSAKIGDTLTYTIVVTNTGNVALNEITVTDAMLKVSEVIDSLAAGAAKTFTYTYKVQASDAGKTLTNTVIAKIGNDTVGDDSAETKVDPYIPTITPVGPSKPALNYEDHINYIIGYEDGFVRPLNTITRAEVATIFFRLLDDESRENFWSKENPFPDVTIDMWCNNAISTMFNAGIITGYPDGTFGPYDPVSRAEFATIAARFSEVKDTDGETNFLDLSKSYWAYSYIELAEELGWVQGYQGYFRPEDDMTRAEVMTTVNRVLKRAVEEDGMLKGMIEWPDNLPSDWFYEDVQEATNSHTYYRTNKRVKDVGTYQPNYCYEKWSELIENPDWAALERAWSDANDK